MADLSSAERESILNAEIRKFSKRGYQLQHSTGTAAQMVLPKPPSTFAPSCLLTIATLGVWLVVEVVKVIIQPIKKEKTLYIEVLPDGTVERTADGLLGVTMKNERHVPKASKEPVDESYLKKTWASNPKLYIYNDRLELHHPEGEREVIQTADVITASAEEGNYLFGYLGDLKIEAAGGIEILVKRMHNQEAEQCEKIIKEMIAG